MPLGSLQNKPDKDMMPWDFSVFHASVKQITFCPWYQIIVSITPVKAAGASSPISPAAFMRASLRILYFTGQGCSGIIKKVLIFFVCNKELAFQRTLRDSAFYIRKEKPSCGHYYDKRPFSIEVDALWHLCPAVLRKQCFTWPFFAAPGCFFLSG